MTARTSERLPGPAELRRLRHARGRSQEDLAERSGISVRALRNIESGHTRPHRSTLHRLAAAADLADRARAAFVELWYPEHQRIVPTDDLLVRPSHVDRHLSEPARRAHGRLHYLRRTCHSFVGPDRSIDRCLATVAVRAGRDGPDRVPVVTQGPQALRRELFRLCELRNCAAGHSLFVPAARAVVTELMFDQPLAAGEQYWCGYTTDYAAARNPGVRSAPGTHTRVGVVTAGTDVTLAVTFDAGCPPAAVWYAYSPCGARGTEVVRPLRLSRFRSVSISMVEADAGIHDIAWAWP